jgi:ectoine hydroxylase-related dioxygenase (phytanoyl-CoA dioxygenase family)
MTAMPSPARQTYEADGFYVHRQPLIPAELISRAVAGMDAVRAGVYETGIPPQESAWNPGDDPQRLCKIEMSHVANHAIRDLVSHPRIGELAADLTGATMVQVWWTQLLYKPPDHTTAGAASNVGWHQDWQYWGIWEQGSEILTAWVALSEVTPSVGPMRFVRGSHTWGLLNQGAFFRRDSAGNRVAVRDLEAQKREIDVPDGAAWEEVPVLLPPGGVSFHHPLAYHGSAANRSRLPRRSFAVHLRTERSRPVGEQRAGLSRFIDDPAYCPVIYGRTSP